MPKRIQRKRTKGWKMPEGAVYVGRPTKWGNPFRIASAIEMGFADNEEQARRVVVEMFKAEGYGPGPGWSRLQELRGKDLVCWCPLDQPCHADVLLEWANAGGDA